MPSQKDAPFGLNSLGELLMREAIRGHHRSVAPFGLNGLGDEEGNQRQSHAITEGRTLRPQ